MTHLLRSGRGRLLRNDYGIVGYVGPNGGGKTLAAVWDTMPALDRGDPVLSTVRLLDFRNPRPCDLEDCPDPVGHDLGHMAAHPGWVPFTDWRQLLDWRDGEVIMDEVSGVASSRDHHSMPGEVGLHLQQLRRGDIIVRWTAPSWARADKVIREVSQIAVACRGFLPRTAHSEPGERPRRWKQRRLCVWRAFDATQFEDFTVHARDRLKPLGVDIHWGPGSPAFDAYDTYDSVLAIGQVNAFGRCMTCGGSRRVPACSCGSVGRTVGRPRGSSRGGSPRAGSAAGGADDPGLLAESDVCDGHELPTEAGGLVA